MAEPRKPRYLEAKGWVRGLDAAGESGGSQPHIFATEDGPCVARSRVARSIA
jgi:hypothetical protein